MGYATEAARYTLGHGLRFINLTLITAMAHIDNKASIKVLEKIGMDFVGEGIVDGCPVRTYTSAGPFKSQNIVKAKK